MEPIATRHLTWTDDDGTREVRVRIWAPVRAEAYRNDWLCDFAIDGLPEPVRAHAVGIDSVQALQMAFAGIRFHLEPFSGYLSFLEERGEHHFPMFVHFYDSDKRRELERLVEATIAEYVAVQMEPHTRAAAQARLRLDPHFVDGDLTGYTARELIDALREASAQRLAHKRDGDREARRYFMEKMFACFRELAKRPEYPDALRALASAGDRDLRLHAAERLSENDTTFLAQLRDEGIEPEAGKAARLLSFMEAEAARHKPWDEPPEIA
jgi:hypothetical protein